MIADFLESGSVILSSREKRNPLFYQREGFLKNFGVDIKMLRQFFSLFTLFLSTKVYSVYTFLQKMKTDLKGKAPITT